MKRILVTPWRRAVQVAAFLLAGPWLAVGVLQCPYGVPFVSCLNCPVTTCRGVWLLLPTLAALGVSQMLLARAFCGWLCPLGFIQDGLAALFGRRRPPRAGSPVDQRARGLKYVFLALVVVAVVVVNYPDQRAYDYVVRSPRLLDLEAARVAAALGLTRYPVRWLAFGVGLAGCVLIARFWCRYLCPLGAALAVVGPLPRRVLWRDHERCQTCSACLTSCAMRTTPGGAECIACFDCADRCHNHAISGRWHLPWSRRHGRDPVDNCDPAQAARADPAPAANGPGVSTGANVSP